MSENFNIDDASTFENTSPTAWDDEDRAKCLKVIGFLSAKFQEGIKDGSIKPKGSEKMVRVKFVKPEYIPDPETLLGYRVVGGGPVEVVDDEVRGLHGHRQA